jgi:hypothetical protein
MGEISFTPQTETVLLPWLREECWNQTPCSSSPQFSPSTDRISLDPKLMEKKQTPRPESTSELYRPSDRHLSPKLVTTFADRGCHMVSVMGPCSHILSFLDRSRFGFFQVTPQLYSRGWVDPVPDQLFLTKSGSAGNRTRAYGSVARNSDLYTTEAVPKLMILRKYLECRK